MASLISPNFSSYELSGQPRQKFSPKLECSSNPKMFCHSCTVDLLSTNSASEASMVKHVKFNHVLDTIFCWFWAESVQCAFVLILKTCSWEPLTMLNPCLVAGEHGLFEAHESKDIIYSKFYFTLELS